MKDDLVKQESERYIELFENITGDKFQRADGTDVLKRIEKNVSDALGKLA